jgi:hypothetical protein
MLSYQWIARKSMLEGDLLTLDLKAMNQADNFGKEFGQYKPAIDTLLGIIKSLRR